MSWQGSHAHPAAGFPGRNTGRVSARAFSRFTVPAGGHGLLPNSSEFCNRLGCVFRGASVQAHEKAAPHLERRSGYVISRLL